MKIICKLSSLPQSSQIVQILERPLTNHGYPEVVIVMIMKFPKTNIQAKKVEPVVRKIEYVEVVEVGEHVALDHAQLVP